MHFKKKCITRLELLNHNHNRSRQQCMTYTAVLSLVLFRMILCILFPDKTDRQTQRPHPFCWSIKTLDMIYSFIIISSLVYTGPHSNITPLYK